ncbi:hypothetical protein [Virgibacillus salexigens]|uniref:DUF1292 domain-containing protein n=1 Tax=Virgibacillus kapii TaxID=1638645 RepID=A0ABQ2DKZ8_9BACI|nr:hypothetical protein [Virgibacillus kapii]GGJ62086.1 hypothetical protein GCM10007111_25260 [Virgibacillus kapii]
MEVYFSLDQDGYVTGMSSSSFSDNEVLLDLEESHPIFTDEIYAYQYHQGIDGGELVLDGAVKQEIIEEEEKKQQTPTDEELNAIALMELAQKVYGEG